MPVKQKIAQTSNNLHPGSFKPESFREFLEEKPVSELVAIIADARDFGMGIIHAEYEQFEEVVDDASN